MTTSVNALHGTQTRGVVGGGSSRSEGVIDTEMCQYVLVDKEVGEDGGGDSLFEYNSRVKGSLMYFLCVSVTTIGLGYPAVSCFAHQRVRRGV